MNSKSFYKNGNNIKGSPLILLFSIAALFCIFSIFGCGEGDSGGGTGDLVLQGNFLKPAP